MSKTLALLLVAASWAAPSAAPSRSTAAWPTCPASG